jgi:hypothetical protein
MSTTVLRLARVPLSMHSFGLPAERFPTFPSSGTITAHSSSTRIPGTGSGSGAGERMA